MRFNYPAPSYVVPSEPEFKSFSKELNEVGLLIVNFFPLVLRVLSDVTPSCICGSPWLFQTLSKESLEINPRQRSFGCLVPTLVLVSTKVDPTTKNMNANGIWLEQIAPAICIKVIFTLFVSLRVQDDWLESGRTNLCRTCHCPKVFLGISDGSCSRD